MTLARYVFAPVDPIEVPDTPQRLRVREEGRDAQALDPIVVQLCAGDEGALRALMRQYYQPLVRFAGAIVRGADAADDIVQDVFVALWNGRARLDPARSVRPYLFTATRNHALNRMKSVRAARTLAEKLSYDAAATPDEELVAQIDAADDAARLAALERAIAALSERRRTALALRFDQGFSYAEGGAVLGISDKAMQQLVIRTVTELRRVLRP